MLHIKNKVRFFAILTTLIILPAITPQTDEEIASPLPETLPVIKMPLRLPILYSLFGGIEIEGGVNLNEGSFYLKSTRIGKPLIPELIPGIFDIVSSPKIEFSSDMGLRVTVETNLFGIKAEMGLVNLSLEPYDLHIIFTELSEALVEKKMAQQQLAAEQQAGKKSLDYTEAQAKDSVTKQAIEPILMQLQSNATFGITPVTPIKLDIPLSRSIELKNIGFFVKPSLPRPPFDIPIEWNLFAIIDFFSRDGKPNTVVEFGQSTELYYPGPTELHDRERVPGEYPIPTHVTYGKLNLSDLPLAEFIPPIKATPLGGLALKDAEIRLQDLHNKDAAIVTFEGKIDLSSLSEILPFNIKLDDLSTRGIVDKYGLTINTSLGLDIPLIPDFVSLKNPAILLTNRFVDRPELTVEEVRKIIGIVWYKEKDTQKNIGKIETIEDAKKKSIPSFTTSGNVELTIPELGTINTRLASTIGPKGFEKFDGFVTNDIQFFDQFSLHNARVQLWPRSKRIELSTAARIMDVDIAANVMIEKTSIKTPDGKTKPGKVNVSFSGVMAEKKDLVPFKDLGHPLDTFKMSNVTMGFNFTKQKFFFNGTTEILGVGITTALQQGWDYLTKSQYTSLHSKMAPNFKLSTMIPEVKGTFIDNLDFTQIHFIISSAPHRRMDLMPPYPLLVNRGINLFATLDLKNLPIDKEQEDLLKVFREAFPLFPKRVLFQGAIGPALTDLNVKAMLNLDIDLRKLSLPPALELLRPPIRLSNFGIGIIGDGPAVNAFGQIEFFPPGQKNSLTFMAMGSFNPNGLDISGTMLGTWDLKFIEELTKIKLTLSDCSLNLGWDFTVSQQLASATATVGGVGALIPSIFGIAGAIQIGKTKVGAKIKIEGDNVMDWGLEAFANRLSLKDLVDFYLEQAKILGISVPIKEDDIPELGLFDARILLSLKGTIIGGVRIPPGFNVKGTLKWHDFITRKDVFTLLDIGMSLDGITGRGTFPEINIGPLLVSGKGLDDQQQQKGPAIDIELSMKRQVFMLTGLVKFFGAESETYIYLGKKGIKFETMTKFFDLFEVELKGEATGSGKNLDFIIDGHLKNDFVQFLKKGVGSAIETLNKQAQAELSKAQDNVKKLTNDIAWIDKEIDKKEEEIKKLETIFEKKKADTSIKAQATRQKLGTTDLHNQLQKGIEDISKLQKQARSDIDRDLSNARVEVDTILKEIKKTEERRDYLANTPWHWTKEKIEWGAITTFKLPALWAAHKAASLTLKAIQDANQNIPTIGEVTSAAETMLLDPSSIEEGLQIMRLKVEIAELKTRKELVIAAKEQALFHLGNFSDIGNFATEVAKDVDDSAQRTIGSIINNMLIIRQAHLRGSLKEFFEQGKLPAVTLKIDFMENKGVEGSFQFDTKKMDVFFNDVAKFLVQVFTVGKNKAKT